MNRTIALLSLFFLCFVVPLKGEEGKMGLDFGLNLLNGTDIGSSSPFLRETFSAGKFSGFPFLPYIAGRVGVEKNLWLRLGASLGYRSQSAKIIPERGGDATRAVEVTISMSSFLFGVTPGLEYIFLTRGPVSVYTGGVLPLGVGSVSTKVGDTSDSQTAFFFGLAPLLGASAKLMENFYLSGEYHFLLGFAQMKDYSELRIQPDILNLILSYRF